MLKKRFLFLVLPLLLLACDIGSAAVPILALPSPTPPPTLTASPIPPTLTLTPSPTDTITLTFTLTFTPSETLTSSPTFTPTATINLYSYVFPIQPPDQATFSKGGHPFPATDIFAPVGTKFVAVTSGTVDQVTTVDTWNPATNLASEDSGLSVRILGDDGLHYYGAHLSSIAYGIHTGLWVPAGKMLGLVGNTGDARYTTPHLHFEVSIPTAPFTKLDPFPLLTAWLAGLQITPPLPTP